MSAMGRSLPVISAEESQSKPVPSKSPTPEWLPILPIPTEAMNKCPPKHRQHGTPSKIWIYRDVHGLPLMVLYRFDLGPDEDGKPRKVFAPLTWCQQSDNQQNQWRWQGLPEPRPLLRLHELTLRTSAPVVLCEGEKAADAAAELFPEYVATCWPWAYALPAHGLAVMRATTCRVTFKVSTARDARA